MDSYDSNEAMQPIIAAGNSGYSLIVPSDYMVTILIAGEDVMKLDEYANEVIFNAMDHTGHLCVMGSEEEEEPILIPEKFPTGPFGPFSMKKFGKSGMEIAR